MNKSELVKSICRLADLTLAESNAFVDAFIDSVSAALHKRDRVNLMGFGAWKVAIRKARTGINPLTKKHISIPAKAVVRFGPSKLLKEQISK